jgi:hypothetical protein
MKGCRREGGTEVSIEQLPTYFLVFVKVIKYDPKSRSRLQSNFSCETFQYCLLSVAQHRRFGPVVRPVKLVDVVGCGGNAPNCRTPKVLAAEVHCSGIRSLFLFGSNSSLLVHAAEKFYRFLRGGPREPGAIRESGESFFAIGERSSSRERERYSEVVQRSERIWIYPALHRRRCVRALFRDSGKRLSHSERRRDRGV